MELEQLCQHGKTPNEMAKKISSNTASNDQYRKKTIKVNKGLKNFCLENNLYLIDNGSTINTRHIDGSKLHLNKNATRILFNNSRKPYPIYSSGTFYYIVLVMGIIVRVVMILSN